MPEGTEGTNGTPPEDGGTPPAGKVTFSTEQQEEINRIVQERLGRERTRLEAETKGKYADYDDLKAKAVELQKIKNADLSEQQRLQKELDDLKAERANWETEKAARDLEISEELLKAEIKAQSPSFSIPWDVAYHLGDFDLEGVTDVVGREKAAKKGLEILVKERPDLVTATRAGGGSPPNEPKKAKADQEAELDSFSVKYGAKIPPKK